MKPAASRSIRFETSPWPLFRVDKNMRYVLKSIWHEKEPFSREDRTHFERAFEYLGELGTRTAPSPKPYKNLRLSAVGDMMWIRDGWDRFLTPALEQHLASRDVRFINLESPVVASRPVPKFHYDKLKYNCPPAYLSSFNRMATKGSRNIFSVCNNHAFDQGPEGLAATRAEILRAPGNSCVGGLDASDIVSLTEVNGVKIATFATTYGINGLKRTEGPVGIPTHLFGSEQEPNWARIRILIEAAKALAPDLIVMMPHWSFEYEYWPEKTLRAHAYRLIEMGVDVILGTAPHVLEPVEVVSINGWDHQAPVQLTRKEAGKRSGVIAYSLGDFATVKHTLACKVGAVLDLDFAFEGNGNLNLTSIKALPTISMRGTEEEDTLLGARVYTESDLRRVDRDPSDMLTHASKMLGPIVVGVGQ